MKIIGAVGLNGQVYRAGSEAQLIAAAEEAEVDLSDERFAGAITGLETADAGTSYSSMKKDELVALAEERGLTVTRSDGEDAEPVKADYVRALEAAE